MDENTCIFVARSRRIRKALMLVGALMLFVAGLILLLAPAAAENHESRTQPHHFPGGPNGRIIGAQLHEPGLLAGG